VLFGFAKWFIAIVVFKVTQVGWLLSYEFRSSNANGQCRSESLSLNFLIQNYWDKRFIFVRVLVDLIAQASQQTQTHNSSYVDAVSFLLQCITDIIQYGMIVH
jgi:hypothetical protein